MTRRLQVLFEDGDLRDIQRVARSKRLTTAEWVRQSLRAARDAEAGADIGQKLAAIRVAADYSFPTVDIDTMLAEIERGYAQPTGAGEKRNSAPGSARAESRRRQG